MKIRNSQLWQRLFRTCADDNLPHQITHQRIYILPSRRGLAFLFTLLVMLVASINYSLSLGYGLCFLLIGLFAATLLHTYRNIAGIAVEAICAQNVFSGESVIFNITLANSGNRERHGVLVHAEDKSANCVDIDRRSKASARLMVAAHQRGACKLGRLTIRSDWPLGLWNCWSYLHTTHQALVFPKPEDQAPPLPGFSGSTAASPSNSVISGDVAGLRDYQPGDSIGCIAWKSAARGLGLQSRLFDTEESLSTTRIDLSSATVHGIEAKLSRLCAWVLQAEQTCTDYAFKLDGLALEPGFGPEHQSQALAALANHAAYVNKAT